MKAKLFKRIATLFMAACMLTSTVAPTVFALDSVASASSSVSVETVEEQQPVASGAASAQEDAEEGGDSDDPDPTSGMDEQSQTNESTSEPAGESASEPTGDPTGDPAGEPSLEIVGMTGSVAAEVGDVVEFSVDTNADAEYQWQKLYTPPAENVSDLAIYPYGEGESTDYYFPIDGMTEAELLALNPDAVWPGIEMYYAELEKLQSASALSRTARVAGVQAPVIENGTKNYVLEPDADAVAESYAWQDIANETSAVFSHTVTAEDEYTSYRCIVSEIAPIAEGVTDVIEEDVVADEATAEPSDESAVESDAVDVAEPQEAVTLVSDSMFVELPVVAPEQAKQSFSLFALFAASSAPAVSLTSDNQWLEGVAADMEYITQDTYNAQNGSAANNTYWTKLSGGVRPDGTKYASTPLTEGKMEVLSAWYGKTIYVRYQGETGKGVAIEIPAYTDSDYQTGQKTLYKKAIKVFNAWVADTGTSFYASYLDTALANGNTPDGGHISMVKATIDNFNKVPTSYLTNAEGDYIYDAVIIGAATDDEPDISGAAAWVLMDYISQGYGFMIGHDMIYGYGGVSTNPNYVPSATSTVTPYYTPNTRTNGHYNMAWLMGQNVYYTESGANPYAAASMILGLGDYTDKSTLYGDDSGESHLNVLKTANGDPLTNVAARTPTNYPYSNRWDGQAMDAETPLQATATHSNQQMAYGTIWVNYASNTITSIGGGKLVTDSYNGLEGTNNFYLTTNGNFAMNQIGHKKGNKDVAKIDECYILANTMFYISQRQQCQVCQSQQGGNEEIHIVRRIATVEQLEKLKDQDKYWFTYPLDGCYMLANDIELPADWTPITGFTGHFNADNHNVTFASGLAEGNQYIFAPSGDGWNLGTDSDNGTTTVYDTNGNKTTGIARVVGYLSALGLEADSLAGYRVEVEGTDGKIYSCITNLDGKYVISNLPCTGRMVARVYDSTGKQITSLGSLRVTIPDGSGIASHEGRTQDFWHSSETTVIYPISFRATPVVDEVVYTGETAYMVEGGVYNPDRVTDITWQYSTNPANGVWVDVATAGIFDYSVASDFIDAGEDSYTSTTLTINDCKLEWSGWHFRAVFKNGNSEADTYSVKVSGKTGKLTVLARPLYLEQALDKTVYNGNTVIFSTAAEFYQTNLSVKWQYRIPGFEWKDLASTDEFAACTIIPATSVQLNAGETNPTLAPHKIIAQVTITNVSLDLTDYQFQAVYTSGEDMRYEGAILGKSFGTAIANQPAENREGILNVKVPNLTVTDMGNQTAKLVYPATVSTDTATYRTEIAYAPGLDANGTVQIPSVEWQTKDTQRGSYYAWNQSVASGKYAGITVTQKYEDANGNIVSNPVAIKTQDGYKIIAVMSMTNLPAAMDEEATHHWFRLQATLEDSRNHLSDTSNGASLSIEYDVDIKHNASTVTKSGSAEIYQYKALDITAPQGLRQMQVVFKGTPSAGCTISYDASKLPAGVTVTGNNQGYHFTSDNLISEADWETFMRSFTFTVEGNIVIYWWGSEKKADLLYDPSASKAYEFVSADKIQWTAAFTAAQTHYNSTFGVYGKLATIANAEEQAAVAAAANGQKVWIGGNRNDSNTWIWNADGAISGYTNWGTSQPATGSLQKYMAMDTNGKWLAETNNGVNEATETDMFTNVNSGGVIGNGWRISTDTTYT